MKMSFCQWISLTYFLLAYTRRCTSNLNRVSITVHSTSARSDRLTILMKKLYYRNQFVIESYLILKLGRPAMPNPDEVGECTYCFAVNVLFAARNLQFTAKKVRTTRGR
ncbi:unnamed protein product [Amoebophrya sp. A25]|nr:unnamed protein product [Amoebophrya sp. A25]|eukprot:GSA25T00004383001.1